MTSGTSKCSVLREGPRSGSTTAGARNLKFGMQAPLCMPPTCKATVFGTAQESTGDLGQGHLEPQSVVLGEKTDVPLHDERSWNRLGFLAVPRSLQSSKYFSSYDLPKPAFLYRERWIVKEITH